MNGSNENNSAAALYRFYRRHRLNDSLLDALYKPTTLMDTENRVFTNADTTPVELADDPAAVLFNRYRNESNLGSAGKELAINSIMQQIEIDSARNRLLSTHFKFDDAVSTAELSSSQNSTSGLIKSLFELPGKLLDTVIKSFTQNKLVMVPATALAVLAVLLVPNLLPTNDIGNPQTVQIAGVTSVPASLLDASSETEFSLTDDMPTMAGFTATISNRSARFHLGQLITHAAAAAIGESDVYTSTVSSALREQQLAANDTAVVEQAGNLADLLEHDEPEAVISALSELNSVQLDDNTELHGWFEFGQIMESILISTELALSQDNLQPLYDSLEQFNQLEPLSLVSSNEPIYRKIAELQLLSVNSTLTLREARQINSLAQSIRALAGQL